MNLILIGKLVNTHGIKGEIKIISDFKYKLEVFKINNYIYIEKDRYKIKSYRHHKIFDMLTLEGLNNINDVINLKNSNVYIDKDEYKFNGYLDDDLIGLEVYSDNIYKGKVVDILKNNVYDLLVIDGIKRHMVPNIDVFVEKIDLENKKIYIKYIKGLDYED